MKRQEQLNEAWCKYIGKCSTEIMQALAFALRWCDEHPRRVSVENELPPVGSSEKPNNSKKIDLKGYENVIIHEGNAQGGVMKDAQGDDCQKHLRKEARNENN